MIQLKDADDNVTSSTNTYIGENHLSENGNLNATKPKINDESGKTKQENFRTSSVINPMYTSFQVNEPL